MGKEIVEEVLKELRDHFRIMPLDITAKQIVINPLDDDPAAVPPGFYPVDGFVINLAGSDSVSLTLYPMANTSASITFTPAVLGRRWSAQLPLAAATDYGLQANIVPRASSPIPSDILFFTTTS